MFNKTLLLAVTLTTACGGLPTSESTQALSPGLDFGSVSSDAGTVDLPPTCEPIPSQGFYHPDTARDLLDQLVTKAETVEFDCDALREGEPEHISIKVIDPARPAYRGHLKITKIHGSCQMTDAMVAKDKAYSACNGFDDNGCPKFKFKSAIVAHIRFDRTIRYSSSLTDDAGRVGKFAYVSPISRETTIMTRLGYPVVEECEQMACKDVVPEKQIKKESFAAYDVAGKMYEQAARQAYGGVLPCPICNIWGKVEGPRLDVPFCDGGYGKQVTDHANPKKYYAVINSPFAIPPTKYTKGFKENDPIELCYEADPDVHQVNNQPETNKIWINIAAGPAEPSGTKNFPFRGMFELATDLNR